MHEKSVDNFMKLKKLLSKFTATRIMIMLYKGT